MNFADWTRALSERGFTIVAPTHPTPIQVCALIPDGGLVLFRCRGTRVTMERHPESALFVAAPVASRGCDCGRSHDDGPVSSSDAPRYIVPVDARPAQIVAYDGMRDRGWCGHEAGLLGPDEAAPLFDTLWRRLLRGRSRDGLDAWDARAAGGRLELTQREVVRIRMQGLAGSSL
ncbi:hypothetical protein ABN028_17030 [Actinopolymorpha sp. B17G11]|uniref:hypothetical protein n=1 Tax=unclassified Actinopolymorpha TaxID=2627063 RepID=UPI0032D9167F